MVAAQVKQIRRRHFEHIGVRRFPAEGRLRGGHGRFKQPKIANALKPAKRGEDGAMDFLHHVHAQVDAVVRRDFHASLRSVLR